MKDTLHCQQGGSLDALTYIYDVAKENGIKLKDDLCEWFPEVENDLENPQIIKAFYSSELYNIAIRRDINPAWVAYTVRVRFSTQGGEKEDHYEVFIDF